MLIKNIKYINFTNNASCGIFIVTVHWISERCDPVALKGIRPKKTPDIDSGIAKSISAEVINRSAQKGQGEG